MSLLETLKPPVKWLVETAKRQYLTPLLKQKSFRAEDGIVIFGAGRSGSTWLMEMMMNIPGACVQWEPLHVEKGVVPTEYNFGNWPYLPPDESDPRFYALFRDIFEYTTFNNWTMQYLNRNQVHHARFVMTKFIRGNLLIPYLISHFEFKHPPVYLLRHPVDTCVSQMKAFYQNEDMHTLLKPKNWIHSERYHEHQSFFDTLKTDFDRLIALWCLNEAPIVNNITSLQPLVVVHYNSLLIDPESEMRRILTELRIENIETIIQSIQFRQPSRMTDGDNLQHIPQEQLMKNFNKLDQASVTRIQHIFDYFKITLFRADRPEPQII